MKAAPTQGWSNVHDQLVYQWMSHELITVYPDTGVIDAKIILDDYHIRRLPVVDAQGNLVGIVTSSDIRRAFPASAKSLTDWELHYHIPSLKVKEIMTKNLVTVYTTDTIARAVTLMSENTVSGLPVIAPADRKLVGIITESDIFAYNIQHHNETEALEPNLGFVQK